MDQPATHEGLLAGVFQASLDEVPPHRPHYFILDFYLKNGDIVRSNRAYHHTEEAEALKKAQRFGKRVPFRYYGHDVIGLRLVKVEFFRYFFDWETETIRPRCGKNFAVSVYESGHCDSIPGGGFKDAAASGRPDLYALPDLLARLANWAKTSSM